MASSFGFWLEKRDSFLKKSLGVNSELHINYWALPDENIHYLDIGVKLNNVFNKIKLSSKITGIYFYLPFEKKHIEYDGELGNIVCNDSELLSAIFNSYVTGTSYIAGSGIYKITLPGGKEMNFFTQIAQENGDGESGVQIGELKDKRETGVKLFFPVKVFSRSIDEDIPTYFRFRIKILDIKALNRISNITKSRVPALFGDFSKIEVVDFRVNEARNLPYKIREKVIDFESINVIHFFLIREAISEFKVSHANYERCRVLETELWDKYLDIDNTKSQKLIYHWKQKLPGNLTKHELKEKKRKGDMSDLFINHFSAFAKFSSNTIPKRAIFIALLLSISIGVASGLVTNNVWEVTKLSSINDDAASCDVVHSPKEKPDYCTMFWPVANQTGNMK